MLVNRILIFNLLAKQQEEKTDGGQGNGSQEKEITNGNVSFKSTFYHSSILVIGTMCIHCLHCIIVNLLIKRCSIIC